MMRRRKTVMEGQAFLGEERYPIPKGDNGRSEIARFLLADAKLRM